jgi:putative oxidoreductase
MKQTQKMLLLYRVIQTNSSVPAAVARLVLGLVILPHGYLKVTNFTAVLAHMTGDYGLPVPVAVGVMLIEFIAPLLLILGVAGRAMVLAIAAVMLGAIPYHIPNGFFMNWFNNQPGEGFEFHLLALGLATIVFLLGSGKYSFDRLWLKHQPAAQRKAA